MMNGRGLSREQFHPLADALLHYPAIRSVFHAVLLRTFSSARGQGPRYALHPMLRQRPLMWRQCVLAIHRMPKLLEFRTTQTVLSTFAISCWARSLRTKFDHLAIPT